MQTDSVEKAAGIGAIGLWAALHGWLGWLVVLYAVCMMLDWVTGTVLAIKNGIWSSHKARQGLWHKGGSIVMIFVSVLTDILLGLTLNHISGLTLPFNYDMLLTPIVLFWYIVSSKMPKRWVLLFRHYLKMFLKRCVTVTMTRILPRYRRSIFLIKRTNAHRLLNRWAFVRFMAFYTMYFTFLARGFMIWSKFYFSVISTVTPDSDKRFPHNMPDNKLLLCE